MSLPNQTAQWNIARRGRNSATQYVFIHRRFEKIDLQQILRKHHALEESCFFKGRIWCSLLQRKIGLRPSGAPFKGNIADRIWPPGKFGWCSSWYPGIALLCWCIQRNIQLSFFLPAESLKSMSFSCCGGKWCFPQASILLQIALSQTVCLSNQSRLPLSHKDRTQELSLRPIATHVAQDGQEDFRLLISHGPKRRKQRVCNKPMRYMTSSTQKWLDFDQCENRKCTLVN